jgi:hypothetical protein
MARPRADRTAPPRRIVGFHPDVGRAGQLGQSLECRKCAEAGAAGASGGGAPP